MAAVLYEPNQDHSQKSFARGRQTCSSSLWYNSKPEVEIDNFLTACFTAHRALLPTVYSVCYVARQVGETAKVPRPQNV